MVKSMTGYAASSCEIATDSGVFACQWEIRSVNGRGLDLRFRLPDWLEGLEPALRKRLPEVIKRGHVTTSLRVTRREHSEETASESPDHSAVHGLNGQALDAALALLRKIETHAAAHHLTLQPVSAADILAMRGVIDSGPDLSAAAPLVAALLDHATPLIADFDANRAAEGAAMAQVIDRQVITIAALVHEARAAASERRMDQHIALKSALQRLQETAPHVEAGRFEQELALIAVKTDVTEELDRLEAHIAAARLLLAAKQPNGRKLDFLMQEFNREANTLCSKSQNPKLTRIGLDLKTVIDQMREQIQNLE
ncbi:YicC family protein [Pararhodobacter oceanensis]|uniref:YicC family protein n=2 Tax=Pararhodobacter oceanensis TaxID=2172121 RepID=A0A2T8HTE8_9RHOB|nr:YicC family protein [Pararhodobacter oceanensis]